MSSDDVRQADTTADQDAWVELAQAIRAQLRKTAEMMPAMTPEEVKTFIEAAREALWLEQNAAAFDKDVELKLQRLPYSD